MSAVLLTGATGFLGTEVLSRLLEQGEREVLALVRARDRAEAEGRLDATLRALYGTASPPGRERLSAVPGELTATGMALRGMDRERVAAEVSDVVHCAASVSFALPWEEAEAINVGGTRRMLELAADLPRLRRFVHVSTAYVGGTRAGRFGEDEHEVGQGFRNTYEQSKHAAERFVTDSGLPVVIARPSIVMGEQGSGWTPVFNVLYWPLRAFGCGVLARIPAAPDGIVDVVPVDYVADGIVAALEASDPPRRLHLVAGEGAATVAELVGIAARVFGVSLPEYVSPGEGPRLGAGEAFVKYFAVRTEFDDARARALLEPLGVAAPRTVDALPALLDYAVRARWGKTPLTRAAARGRLAVAAAAA